MERLRQFVAGLRETRPGTQVPDFDPLDGGTEAALLFVLEKPGPRTCRSDGGSGFVSRDNDNGTAEAIFRFSQEAGIERRDALLWNVVPWWNGTTRITAAEHRDGLAALRDLVPLLPRVRAAVLVGRRAGAAAPMLEARGLRTFASAHPSGQVRARRPDVWRAIPEQWALAARQ